MTNNFRVLNLTRGFSMKHKQALRAIENCAAEWVEVGISIRDLSLAESVAKRNQQARAREPVAPAEIPGLIFRPPVTALASAGARASLLRAANQFCVGYAGR